MIYSMFHQNGPNIFWSETWLIWIIWKCTIQTAEQQTFVKQLQNLSSWLLDSVWVVPHDRWYTWTWVLKAIFVALSGNKSKWVCQVKLEKTGNAKSRLVPTHSLLWQKYFMIIQLQWSSTEPDVLCHVAAHIR